MSTRPNFINIDDEFTWVKQNIDRLIAHQGYFIIRGPIEEDLNGKVIYYAEPLFGNRLKVRIIGLAAMAESHKDCEFLGIKLPNLLGNEYSISYYRAILVEDEVLLENANEKPHTQVETITIPSGPTEG